MNKSYWPIIAVLFLSACEEHKHIPLPMGGTESTPAQRDLYVFMGQSNALGLYNYGLEPFQRAFPQADFVNCSVSGTPLSRWQKGADLYEACLAAVGMRHVTGIIFWQGEYEGSNGPTSASDPFTWASRFTQFIHDIRSDWANPSIFYVRLGNMNAGPWWHVMREQQDSITTSHVYEITIDTVGWDAANLPHYSPEGYTAIAELYVQRMLS